MNQVHSDECPTESGVPRGATLGPLAFLVYITDLPVCIAHSDEFIFVDDATVTLFGKGCVAKQLSDGAAKVSY